MSRIQRETVADRVIAELRQDILHSRLPQGRPVTEDAMAEQLGVSRTTMRQALNTLLIEGLLTRHPATRVLEVTTLGEADVSDIYRARRFLELGGVDAAASATPEHLDRLRRAVHDLRHAVETDDPETFVRADFDCHAAIVAFLGSWHLSEAYALLISKLRIVIARIVLDEQDNVESLAVHEEFIKQILAGNHAEAREGLGRRLDESERMVLAKIAEGGR